MNQSLEALARAHVNRASLSLYFLSYRVTTPKGAVSSCSSHLQGFKSRISLGPQGQGTYIEVAVVVAAFMATPWGDSQFGCMYFSLH